MAPLEVKRGMQVVKIRVFPPKYRYTSEIIQARVMVSEECEPSVCICALSRSCVVSK